MAPLPYPIDIRYSAEDQCFIASAPDLPGCLTHGATAAEAVAEFEVAAAAWLEVAREMGQPVPPPPTGKSYAGKVLLRLPVWLHATLDRAAERNKTSLNQHLVALLAAAQATPRPASSGTGAKKKPPRARAENAPR